MSHVAVGHSIWMRRAARVLRGAPVLLAVVALAAACSEQTANDGDAPGDSVKVAQPRRGRPNLLLVTLDTTRADALGSYGQIRPTSPELDALAKRGVLFEQVTTSNPETLPAHTTIFTGVWPFSHGVRSNSGYVVSRSNVTLAEVLRARGYRTGAEVAASVLRSETLVTQGFDHYRGPDSPDVEFKQVFFSDGQGGSRTTHTRVGRDITRGGIEFIDENKDQPFFLWLHYFDAHDPYSAPVQFNNAIPDSPYHAEVAHDDFEVGQVLAELDRLGLAKNTLVVVTADHGEDLGDHGEVSHSYGVYQTTMHVPLILAGLPQLVSGQRIPWAVRTIDIAPTVLDLLGQTTPPSMQGVSLAPLLANPAQDPALLVYGESTRYATVFNLPVVRFVREGRWKYIYKVGPELYDVVADPDERTNRIAEHPEVAATLRGKLEALLKGATAAPTDATTEVDRETAAELSVLGYLGHDVPEIGAGGEDLKLWGVDPNLALPDAKLISEAQGLMLRKDFVGAWQRLGPIVERYPESRLLLDLEATTQFELGHPDVAADALRRILALEPCDAKAGQNLQGLLRRQGRGAEQAAALASAAAACPDDRDLLNNYAWVLATAPDASLRDGARAVEIARHAVGGETPPSSARLDTLACALAENGSFEEAVRTLNEALARARAEGVPPPVLQIFEQHLASFREGQPVRAPL